MSNPIHASNDERGFEIEDWISRLLRVGVSISLVIVVLGTIVILLQTGASTAADLQARLSPSASFPHTPAQVWAGLRAGDGPAIVVLGLMVLLATPFLRVAMSAIAFAAAKDWAYVWITLTVLALLAASLLIGTGHE
ncbi:MAG TPA: DUF1634 domain-containing protein [Tepidisphaeraceae bacterium]|jgi:uncharacterized membrane protein